MFNVVEFERLEQYCNPSSPRYVLKSSNLVDLRSITLYFKNLDFITPFGDVIMLCKHIRRDLVVFRLDPRAELGHAEQYQILPRNQGNLVDFVGQLPTPIAISFSGLRP